MDQPSERPGEARSTAPPKTPTGIPGLDEILLGGVPEGRITLVRGGPGTGKTVLGLEFIYRGAVLGEPGIFVTFEERAEVVRQNARSLGWELEPLERDGRLLILQPDLPANFVESGEFDLSGLLAILDGHSKALGAKRIVIDAADVILRLFRSPHDRENQLFALHYWLWRHGQTAVLTLKMMLEQSRAHDRLEYMVDCVLHLDNRVIAQVTTRRLRVIKYRGSGFLSNEFPCIITNNGMALMPITRPQLGRKVEGKVSTGVAGLDSLLDGGLARGTCVLIGGTTGTGKTTIASSFATAACQRQERVLYVNFEESVESLTTSMKSSGFDLTSTLEEGCLNVIASMPESMGAEEHLWRLFQVFDDFAPEHLIVDAISACRRMGSQEVAFDFLVRLLTYCRSRGVTCIFLNQSGPGMSAHSISGVGVSSLVDTLIVLEQDWPSDMHRRRLLIVKSRGSRHSHVFHTFEITDDGIRVDSEEPVAAPLGKDDA